MTPPPPETALGAILAHVTGGADAETFQPMNVNFGLMPPLPGRWKRADRKKAYTDRAREKLAGWLKEIRHPGLEPGSTFLQSVEAEKVDAGSGPA
jgi:methylenetetrahydrofolate--tRNA-(uracil-5-)-methyltransferase